MLVLVSHVTFGQCTVDERSKRSSRALFNLTNVVFREMSPKSNLLQQLVKLSFALNESETSGVETIFEKFRKK